MSTFCSTLHSRELISLNFFSSKRQCDSTKIYIIFARIRCIIHYLGIHTCVYTCIQGTHGRKRELNFMRCIGPTLLGSAKYERSSTEISAESSRIARMHKHTSSVPSPMSFFLNLFPCTCDHSSSLRIYIYIRYRMTLQADFFLFNGALEFL